MTDSLLVFWFASIAVCAGHLFLSFSKWHPDGVIGSIAYGAVGVLAGVPALAFLFRAEEYVAAFDAAPSEVRGFLVWFFAFYASQVMWRVFVTQRDRRRAGRKENRRGAIERPAGVRADAVRY